MRKFIYSTAFGLPLTLLSSYSAMAESGKVAHALPIANIVIDGDLSDWPQSASRYKLEQTLYGDVRDRDADFQVGWNAIDNSLYIGLRVSDPTSVLRTADDPYYLQDTHVLYVDFEHSKRGSGPEVYFAYGPNFSPLDQPKSWKVDLRTGSTDDVTYAFSREGEQSFYEWKIKSPKPLRGGLSFGLDHTVSHIDQQNADNPDAISMWGPYGGKTQRAGRLGDVLIIDPDQPSGRVKGQIKWADTIEGPDIGGWRVKVESVNDADFWFQHVTQKDRHFTFDLPVGDYVMTSPFPLYQDNGDKPYRHRIKDETSLKFEVLADQETALPPFTWDTMAAPKIKTAPGHLFNYSNQDEANLTDFIEKALSFYDVTGASIALVRDGQTIYSRDFGYKNNYAQLPVTRDTLFEAGSVTKLVFAFAVMRLVEQGVIDLDRPLHEYLIFDEISDDPRARLITARHILSHRSGLPNWRTDQADGQLAFKFIPGTEFGYSGEAFQYLAKVVETITEKSIEDILIDEAIRPMNISDGYMFYDQGTLIDRVAFGHDLGRAATPQLPDAIGTAYSLQTHSRALAQFMAGLQRRHGLSESSYDLFLTPITQRPTTATREKWPQHYGLGVNIMETTQGPAFGHSGLNGYNHALFENYADHDAGFIVLTNSDTGRSFYQALRDYLILGEHAD